MKLGVSQIKINSRLQSLTKMRKSLVILGFVIK